jgi:D-alanyl-D-alanine carboxypeptidase (penicillin-binding protein 5/6)
MKPVILKYFAATFAALAIFNAPVGAQQAEAFSTRAPRAFMIDAETGAVLFAKAENETFSPASLAKIMTAQVVFDAIKNGTTTEEAAFKVSEHAWRTGGAPSRTATMFAAVNSEVSVNNLLRGLMVVYANDAAIALAEGLGGSEAGFAKLMNEQAARLQLTNSQFVNPTGFPADGQRTSVKDMALLARHLWKTYPLMFTRFAMPEFSWNKITQQNKNPLMKLGIGSDGLVAGFAEGEGYSIAATAEKDGRRLFVALGGLEKDNQRIEEARSIIGWGMRAFEKVELFSQNETVGEASVFGGDRPRIKLRANGAVSILVPIGGGENFVGRILYRGPVSAPVEQGAEIAKLAVYDDKFLVREVPLYAAEPVVVGSTFQRAWGAIYELAFGWFRGLMMDVSTARD